MKSPIDTGVGYGDGWVVSGMRCSLLVLAITALLAGVGRVAADPAAAAVSTLSTHDLVGTPGKEVVVLTVEYPPGGSSAPHRHDANVFVYVLEGTVVMQVRGKEKMTLSAGQTFYEGPSDVHVVSANASTSRPAKILVTMIKDKGAPLSRPAQGQ